MITMKRSASRGEEKLWWKGCVAVYRKSLKRTELFQKFTNWIKCCFSDLKVTVKGTVN